MRAAASDGDEDDEGDGRAAPPPPKVPLGPPPGPPPSRPLGPPPPRPPPGPPPDSSSSSSSSSSSGGGGSRGVGGGGSAAEQAELASLLAGAGLGDLLRPLVAHGCGSCDRLERLVSSGDRSQCGALGLKPAHLKKAERALALRAEKIAAAAAAKAASQRVVTSTTTDEAEVWGDDGAEIWDDVYEGDDGGFEVEDDERRELEKLVEDEVRGIWEDIDGGHVDLQQTLEDVEDAAQDGTYTRAQADAIATALLLENERRLGGS